MSRQVLIGEKCRARIAEKVSEAGSWPKAGQALGVNQWTLYRLYRGERGPSYLMAQKLKSALHLSTTDEVFL